MIKIKSIPLLVFLMFISCKQKKAIKVERKDINEVVYASGKLLPTHDYKLFSLADGMILKILVKEGEIIHKGQALMIIDNSPQKAKSDANKIAYENALHNQSASSPYLKEAYSMIESAQKKYKNDSTNYSRLKTLFSQNVGTKAELEKSELAYKISLNEHQIQLNRLEKLKLQLAQELKNAKAQLIASNQDANNYIATSNLDGKVYDILKKEGETVRRNEALGTLGDKTESYLQLWIDEADILKIKEGQLVLVKTEIEKSKIYEAAISKIYPALNLENHSVKVEAIFTKSAPPLIAFATIEANILIQSKKGALVIPKNVITGNDSVNILKNNKITKIKFTKGIETTEFVEVISGIDENTNLEAPNP